MMDQPVKPSADDAEVTAKSEAEVRLAGEVVLFLHAGGLPIEAVARQLEALKCFGEPDAHFDLDGPMWAAVNGADMNSFPDYLADLIDREVSDAGLLSALIDYRDLLWLEQRRAFKDQLCQRLRVVRLAFLDPALQAFRRVMATQSLQAVSGDQGRTPGFADLARELVEIEEAEQIGEDFCRRHDQPVVKLWVEDLARSGVPALRGLLDRWSLRLPEGGQFLPIDQPPHAELEAVAAFRAEADRRHWSHALLPDRS